MKDKYLLLPEIQNRKSNLEKEILKLLQDFEDETKTEVDNIEMDHIRGSNGKVRVFDLRLKIYL